MVLSYEDVKDITVLLKDSDPLLRLAAAGSIVELCGCDCISDKDVKAQVARDILEVLPKETGKVEDLGVSVKPFLVRALSALGSSVAVEPLLEEAEKDKDVDFTANVAGAFGDIDYGGAPELREKATNWLFENLKNSGASVRASCFSSLGKIDCSDNIELQDKVVDAVTKALENENDLEAIFQGVKTLIKIDEREAAKEKPIIDDTTKVKLIKSAAKFKDPRLALAYRQCVASDPEIKKAVDEKAIDGLKSLTPEDRRIVLSLLGDIGTKPTVRMDIATGKNKDGKKMVA